MITEQVLMMENVILILLLLALAVGVVIYLVRAKKRGEKCIGCPYAKQCGGKCGNHGDTIN